MIPAELKRHIAAHPVCGSPSQMRHAFAALAGAQPSLRMETYGGVPCSVAGQGEIAAIWLHGGGYVFGGPESHGNCVRELASQLGGKVLLPHYRLAPDHVWPTQLRDAQAVLDALHDPVPVIGDSAGGHLALHLAFTRSRRVSALALIGPNTDRTGQNESRGSNSTLDRMNDDAQDTALARLAFCNVADDSIASSPLLGPLERLPRLFLTCAANEVLADDCLLLARAAALAGTAVDLRVERGLCHMWTLWPHRLPQAATTLAKIAEFIGDVRHR